MPISNSLNRLSVDFTLLNIDAAVTGPQLAFRKTRSLAGGPVVSGDEIANIYVGGSDSASNLSTKLAMQAVSTGTIGPDRIPFSLRFYTAQDAALAPNVLRLAIASDGTISMFQSDTDTATIGTPAPSLGVLGSSLIATNAAVSNAGAYTATLKNRAGGAVVTGDALGTLGFIAADTVPNEILSASINAVSTGTIGAAKVPSDMFFSVSDDATGALNVRLSILEDGLVAVDQQLSVGGDLGAGTASNVDFTNVTDLTANGAGVFTILSKSANPLNSSGFLKIYVNGVIYYIPLFNAVAP